MYVKMNSRWTPTLPQQKEHCSETGPRLLADKQTDCQKVGHKNTGVLRGVRAMDLGYILKFIS